MWEEQIPNFQFGIFLHIIKIFVIWFKIANISINGSNTNNKNIKEENLNRDIKNLIIRLNLKTSLPMNNKYCLNI